MLIKVNRGQVTEACSGASISEVLYSSSSFTHFFSNLFCNSGLCVVVFFFFSLFFSSVSFLPCLFPVLWFLQIMMNKSDSGIPLVLSYMSVFWSLHSGITNSSRKCNMGQEKEELKKRMVTVWNRGKTCLLNWDIYTLLLCVLAYVFIAQNLKIITL